MEDETLTQETNKEAIINFCEQNPNYSIDEIKSINPDPFCKPEYKVILN